MDFYILRHGDAEPRGAGVAEASRALTERGRADVRRVLKHVRAKLAPQVILTSPYKRAAQTAEIAAKVLQVSRTDTTSALLPSAKPETLWKELTSYSDVDRILVAGHEPHVSRLLSFLLGMEAPVEIKKGALLRLQVARPPAAPQALLKWLIAPSYVR